MEHILEKQIVELKAEIKWLKELIDRMSVNCTIRPDPTVWDPFGETTTGAPIMVPTWKCKVNGEQQNDKHQENET